MQLIGSPDGVLISCGNPGEKGGDSDRSFSGSLDPLNLLQEVTTSALGSQGPYRQWPFQLHGAWLPSSGPSEKSLLNLAAALWGCWVLAPCPLFLSSSFPSLLLPSPPLPPSHLSPLLPSFLSPLLSLNLFFPFSSFSFLWHLPLLFFIYYCHFYHNRFLASYFTFLPFPPYGHWWYHSNKMF